MTTGVLLLHGSSGKPDLGRVKILEAEGFAPDGTTTQTSPWTWRGEPLPFVPFDESWTPDDDPPSYVGYYQQSLRFFPEQAEAAQIPAERFGGDLLLMAGGDDQLWPSVKFAKQIALRRGTLITQVLISGQAGHRPLFPGEEPNAAGQRMARGGSDEADRAFGAQAWPHVVRVLKG